jgi:ATP-binding cassette subfamily B (MDR/TAP) protein 1
VSVSSGESPSRLLDSIVLTARYSASGSGKSTITALLQRLYEPTSGSILLDGRPLERTDVKYLRDHIALVSQHPTLFDMSIADNITYGITTPPSSHSSLTAATSAQAHEFISSLPKGYGTMLGENASLISGGQAQRLQIARALIRPREILILDECTSALDSSNQFAVMETIKSVKIGRTTLIVTHKLDVMKLCDRLVIVHEGRVVESGTVQELYSKAGVFASLARSGEWES